MATASTVVPTEEKTYGFRLLSLVIDGGTLVLRHRFDQAIPPIDLEKTLNDQQVRKKLDDLWKNKIITKDQWNLLYINKPDSSKFDITLLTWLLRYICGLDEHAQAWKCIPSSMDTTTEADIKKLKVYRNEMSHLKSLSVTKQVFMQKWNDFEQVILRLGNGIPTLQSDIQKLKHSSIDPERERYYQEKLQECQEIDNIKAKLTDIDSNVKYIEKKIEQIEVTSVKRHEVESLQSHVEKAVQEVRQKEEEEQTQKTGGLNYQTTSELENLRSVTQLYLDDVSLDELYVETTSHMKAKETLIDTNCLILTGLPGEGKTTMAIRLISEVSNVDSVLKLREPSDWKLVNLEHPSLDMIFIDDIFGPGCFDEQLHRGWSKCLPDIEKAVKKKKLKVIITSRHYILQEAKEKMRRLHIFRDKNEVILDSAKLTMSERTLLLEKHMQHSNKTIDLGFTISCDNAYREAFTSSSYPHLPGYLSSRGSYIWGGKRVGFPQIVDIFVNTEELYKQGPSFFTKPIPFFKTCMEDLFLDKESYLALILIWSQPKQILYVRDLDPYAISSTVQTTVMKFQFECKIPLFKAVNKSLKHHKDGFLKFDPKSGSYSFSHNIVKDMVGLVAGQEYPKAVLEFANRDFIMQYITVDQDKNDGFHVYFEEYQFETLRKVICDKLLFCPAETRYSFNYQFGEHKLFRLRNLGQMNLNASSLAHDCFMNKSFITMFYCSEEGNYLLSRPVATLSTEFYQRYGLRVPERKQMIYLPTLALYFRNTELLDKFLDRKLALYSGSSTQFLETSLLIAVHVGLKSTAEVLLNCGAASNESTLLIASVNEDIELLTLLVRRRVDYDTQSYIINDNSALIAAARRGLVSSVRCLIDHGVEIDYRNTNGMSALDKSVIYRQYEVCRILLENGARVNNCKNKYKRTPLHIVADVGGSDDRFILIDITKLLIQHGASLFTKDYRGHLPVHCAAIRGQIDILETLLETDISQASVRVTSYGTRSLIKGMDLFHIAVWKNNPGLIDILLKHEVNPNCPDSYGRTPFYRAVYEGKAAISRKLLKVAVVRQAEKTGYTPLHAAVHSGNYRLVKMICPFADVNSRDKYGKTPIHAACEKKDLPIFRLLVEDHKADVRMLTNKGQTVFSILQSRKPRTSRNVFEKFRSIVENVDYEFACKWEQLSSCTAGATK